MLYPLLSGYGSAAARDLIRSYLAVRVDGYNQVVSDKNAYVLRTQTVKFRVDGTACRRFNSKPLWSILFRRKAGNIYWTAVCCRLPVPGAIDCLCRRRFVSLTVLPTLHKADVVDLL